jgi:hypothetical protein
LGEAEIDDPRLAVDVYDVGQPQVTMGDPGCPELGNLGPDRQEEGVLHR